MARARRVFITARAVGFVITTPICGDKQRRSMDHSGASGPPVAHGFALTSGITTNLQATNSFLRARIR